MLTFVYHPIDGRRIVEDDEAERLQAKGVWFDCPYKAKKYREQIEQEIKQEKADELKKEEPKVEKPKAKTKGKSNER